MTKMKLTDELLNEFIKEIIGSDAVSLVQYIKNKEDVSEFKIAEELGLNINIVRNMLYRLGSHNLVSSIRKKDKKKGWYIYYWTFNIPRSVELIMKSKEKKLENLKNMFHRISNETFFVCKVDGTTLGFESAMEHSFKCPEDGELLVQKDSHSEIERLKREIEKLHVEITSGIEIDEKLMGIKRKRTVIKPSKKEKTKLSLKEKKSIKDNQAKKEKKIAKTKANLIRRKVKMLRKKKH